jgi:hypothetical protein
MGVCGIHLAVAGNADRPREHSEEGMAVGDGMPGRILVQLQRKTVPWPHGRFEIATI